MNKLEKLTKQEYRILSMIADGYTDAEIMKKLYIEQCTLKTHISHIYTKIGLKSKHNKGRTTQRIKAALYFIKHTSKILDSKRRTKLIKRLSVEVAKTIANTIDSIINGEL